MRMAPKRDWHFKILWYQRELAQTVQRENVFNSLEENLMFDSKMKFETCQFYIFGRCGVSVDLSILKW